MSNLVGSCIVGQSGGPTSVINSSILGAVKAALESDCVTNVYGAENGIVGVLNDRLIDLSKEDSAELELLLQTPSAALGSCRYKIADPEKDDTDYKRLLEIFKKYDVRYFFYNGGNDSMDTCNKISRFMASSGYECRIMGIPKTIDNDLWGTDHCPGFGSAAKYIATSCAEVCLDAHVYDSAQIVVMEIMGRNAGWLAASSALACYVGAGPDLIYLPENVFSIEKLIADVKDVLTRKKVVFIAVSEGIRDKDGVYISTYGSNVAEHKDAFGHAQMGGLSSTLSALLKKETGVKARSIEVSSLQRCAAHCASQTDIDEAYMSGREAVLNAVAGKTGMMVALERVPGEAYKCQTKLIPLADVANVEKTVPKEMINDNQNGMTQAFIDYALPLIQGDPVRVKENSLPRFAKLKKIMA